MTDTTQPIEINLGEIKEIDIVVLRRLQELIGGDHKSFFKGDGFDLVGLRDWQPGDKISSIDWPQSTMNNFNPLVVMEFEEDKNGTILIVTDASLSMGCGIDGFSSRNIVSRAIATIGLSGVFFQDLTGLFIFDHKYNHVHIRPRMGKNNIISCISHYLNPSFSGSALNPLNMTQKILGCLRRPAMIPVISDFLFEDADDFIKDISNLKSRHDLFLIVTEASFLFELPETSDGWVECLDIENGKTMLLSRKEFMHMSGRAIDHQAAVIQRARQSGLEVLKAGRDKNTFYNNFTEFFFNRRTRRRVVS